MRSTLFASLALGLVAACATTENPFATPSVLDAPPANFNGFPPQTLQGIVFASARWVPDHEELFGVDLISRAGVVPVAVTVRLRGQGQSEAQVLLNPERMDPELVLQDGTVLAAVGVEDVIARLPARYAATLRSRALKTGLVSANGEEGFLFFALEPQKSFDVDGTSVVHETEVGPRALSLVASLLTFGVVVDGAVKPFYVGLQH